MNTNMAYAVEPSYVILSDQREREISETYAGKGCMEISRRCAPQNDINCVTSNKM